MTQHKLCNLQIEAPIICQPFRFIINFDTLLQLLLLANSKSFLIIVFLFSYSSLWLGFNSDKANETYKRIKKETKE